MEKAPNRPLLSDSKEDVSDSVSKALGIDRVRERILDYAIHDHRKEALSCRLVNKAWRGSTHSVLLALQEPLFLLNLNMEHFIVVGQRTCVTEIENENLCIFLLSFGGNNSTHVPPHRIEAIKDFFRLENYPSFFRSLITCGSSLVELYVELGSDKDCDHPIPLNNTFQLPNLREFTARFVPNEKTLPDSIIQNKIDFIQSVLWASEKLQSFLFDCQNIQIKIPISFGSIQLPASLTEIELDCPLTDSCLAVLLNNSLPKLKCLVLYADKVPFKDGLITSILETFCKTLEIFYVMGSDGICENSRPTTFQLPMMDKLKELRIKTSVLRLEGNTSCLQNLLPVLKHLTLTQTNGMLRKWTEESCFPTVESLSTSVSFENSNHMGNGPLELRTMEALAHAFSNVKLFKISFKGTQVLQLAPVLREMKSLRHLKIHVKEHVVNSNIWDALFLAIPVETVAKLRKSPASLEGLQVVDANASASIRNLTDLHTLDLRIKDFTKTVPILSDVVFNFAFLKMPRLVNLIFRGGFTTARENMEQWTLKKGRRIYLDYDDVGDYSSDDDDDVKCQD